MTEADVTQIALAGAAGVEQSTVSKWVNGTLPGSDYLAKIAARLSTSPSWLLGWPDGETARGQTRLAEAIAVAAPGKFEDQQEVFQQATIGLFRLREKIEEGRDSLMQAERELRALEKLLPKRPAPLSTEGKITKDLGEKL